MEVEGNEPRVMLKITKKLIKICEDSPDLSWNKGSRSSFFVRSTQLNVAFRQNYHYDTKVITMVPRRLHHQKCEISNKLVWKYKAQSTATNKKLNAMNDQQKHVTAQSNMLNNSIKLCC